LSNIKPHPDNKDVNMYSSCQLTVVAWAVPMTQTACQPIYCQFVSDNVQR